MVQNTFIDGSIHFNAKSAPAPATTTRKVEKEYDIEIIKNQIKSTIILLVINDRSMCSVITKNTLSCTRLPNFNFNLNLYNRQWTLKMKRRKRGKWCIIYMAHLWLHNTAVVIELRYDNNSTVTVENNGKISWFSNIHTIFCIWERENSSELSNLILDVYFPSEKENPGNPCGTSTLYTATLSLKKIIIINNN